LRYLEYFWQTGITGPSTILGSFREPEFSKLNTLVLGGTSLFTIGTESMEMEARDPTSLVKLLPPSIVEVRIDSQHLHEGMYRPMVALGEEKRAGLLPELRSFLQSSFDASKVPYTLDNLRELSERYRISFQQEAGSIFPPPEFIFRATRPDVISILRARSVSSFWDELSEDDS
jgi:hypothetical protein